MALALLTPVPRAWCSDDDDTLQAKDESKDMYATTDRWYRMRIGLEKTGTADEFIYIKAYLLVPDVTDPKRVQVKVSYPELVNGWQEGTSDLLPGAQIVFRNKKKVQSGDIRLFFRFKITATFPGPGNILFEFRTADGETTAPIGYAIVAAGSPQVMNADEKGAAKDDESRTVKSPIGVGRH